MAKHPKYNITFMLTLAALALLAAGPLYLVFYVTNTSGNRPNLIEVSTSDHPL